MGDLVNKIELQLTGRDVSASSTVDKVVEHAERKFEKASRPRSVGRGGGSADRSLLPEDERLDLEAEDIVAGRRLAADDQRRRQEASKRADALMGKPGNPTEGEEAPGVLDRLKGLFGRGSMTKEVGELLTGGGVVAGASLVAGIGADYLQQVREVREQLELGEKSEGQVTEEVAKQIPLYGQIVRAGREIHEVLFNEEGPARITRALAEMTDKASAFVRAAANTWKEYQDRAGEAVRAVQAQVQANSTPGSSDHLLAAASATERIIGIRKGARDDRSKLYSDSQAQLDDLQKRKENIESQSVVGVLGTFFSSGPLAAYRAARDLRGGQQSLSSIKQRIDQIRRGREGAGKGIDKAAEEEIKAVQQQFQQGLVSEEIQRQVTDVIEKRRDAQSAGFTRREAGSAAASSIAQQQVGMLRRAGYGREADYAGAVTGTQAELRALDDAHAREMASDKLGTQERIALQEKYQTDRAAIVARGQSAVDDLQEQWRQEDERKTRDHAANLLSLESQTATTRLRAAGASLQAERVQLAEGLRQQLETIERNRAEEVQKNEGQRDAINKRAAEDAAAAIGLYNANADAISQRRGGFDVNRGPAGSEGRLGARLTAAEVATPLRSDPAKETKSAVEKAGKDTIKAIQDLTKAIGGPQMQEAFVRALQQVFATPGTGGA